MNGINRIRIILAVQNKTGCWLAKQLEASVTIINICFS